MYYKCYFVFLDRIVCAAIFISYLFSVYFPCTYVRAFLNLLEADSYSMIEFLILLSCALHIV